MKINEILKRENVGKRYKDEFDKQYTLRECNLLGNVGLIDNNDSFIENTMYLDDILEMDFQEITSQYRIIDI